MSKRTPSRNARSRGFRVKHVLQICLLLGVCFWLLYQVKHSHDKKKEFDEKDTKISARAQNDNGIIDFGRKDLHPRLGEETNDEKHEEDDDEETIADGEVNKIEEIKHEEKELIDENKHGEEQEGTKHEEDEQEEQTKNEEDEREDRNKYDEEEKEKDGNKHGEAETEEGNKHEEDEREEGNEHEEEEREGGNEHEEEEREGGNEHEEEEREGGNEHEEEEREGVNEHEEEERVEENKHEEEDRGGNKLDYEEQEEETRSDETKDEGRGEGDDEIDEHDQQKIGGVADQDEESAEKESGNDDHGDNKETHASEASTEDQDHDGGTQDNHEAREVHYQADDASSAVTHDTQNMGTEPGKISLESSSENLVMNDIGPEKNSSEDNRKDVKVDQKNSTSRLGEGAMAEKELKVHVKTGEEKSDETINREGQSLKSATADKQLSTDKSADVNTEAGENLRGGSIGISGTSQQKETLVTSDPNNAQNKTVDGADNVEASNLKIAELEQANNNTVSGGEVSDSTSTVSNKTENNGTVVEDSHSSINSELNGSNKTFKLEVTSEAEISSGSSSMTNETRDAAQDENSDIKNESGGTDDNSGSSAADGTGADVHDPIDSTDSSIGQDEKEARINLDTLPENSIEGVNSRDTAAE